MYKSRTGGHNKSSTKEKRNTYPPLFNTLSVAEVQQIRYCIFWQKHG